ncbi:MAG: pectinacetylesterase family protein [Lachnospiraceae bacterium]|nr:pectinacetylesterase family protein [Lachnospiraceae bacterium]
MNKNGLIKLNIEKGLVFASRLGDFVENSLGNRIQSKYDVTELPDEPEVKQWYKVTLAEGIAGDGSGYHVYVSKGRSKSLCVIVSGGGVAWNEYTAARPVTGGKMVSGQPNFYWNNLRPVTQIMNVNIGITDIKNDANPFADWNFIVVTYATGDFHVGNNDFPYISEDGEEEILHFHGHKNFREAMKVAKKLFPEPDRILMAGNSAGAFAVPALASELADDFYPDCSDITLFSDSGQLLFDDWRRTAKEIWKADERIWSAITSDNITLDWYRSLYASHGDRFRYLYGSSTRDFLLSAYYNDIINKEYKTDKDVQQAFYEQLCEMLVQLREITDKFGFYIFDWPMPNTIGKGGTVHTALKELYFFWISQDGKKMPEWLIDQINGKRYDIGMDLINKA